MEGLSPELRILIDRDHIQEGPLFARLPLPAVTDDERVELEQLGWRLRPYRDRPVLEPPEATFTWDRHLVLFRDNMRHAAAHRLPDGLPVAGPKEAILDELIASIFEERMEELRTVLAAFSFASAWRREPDEAEGPEALSAGWDAAEETLMAEVGDGEDALIEVEGLAGSDQDPNGRMEGMEVFFFYTESMRKASVQALTETVRTPDEDDPVWTLVESLR